MVVADISGSVAAFARFTLQLVYAMPSQFSKVRSFVFIDGIDEVTRFFEESDDIAEAVHRVNTEADVVWVDGHSDYGHAFEVFWHERYGKEVDAEDDRASCSATPATTTTRRRRGSSRRCARGPATSTGSNPEPRGYWDTGDSIVGEYGAHCDGVYECRNLRQLETFVEQVAEAADPRPIQEPASADRYTVRRSSMLKRRAWSRRGRRCRRARRVGPARAGGTGGRRARRADGALVARQRGDREVVGSGRAVRRRAATPRCRLSSTSSTRRGRGQARRSTRGRAPIASERGPVGEELGADLARRASLQRGDASRLRSSLRRRLERVEARVGEVVDDRAPPRRSRRRPPRSRGPGGRRRRRRAARTANSSTATPSPRSRTSMPTMSPSTAPMRDATRPSAPGRSGSQTRRTSGRSEASLTPRWYGRKMTRVFREGEDTDAPVRLAARWSGSACSAARSIPCTSATSSSRPSARPARASTGCCSSSRATRGRSAGRVVASAARPPRAGRGRGRRRRRHRGVRDRGRARRGVGHRRHARGAVGARTASSSSCSAPTRSRTCRPGAGSTRPATSPRSWSSSAPATCTPNPPGAGLAGRAGRRSRASTSRRPTCAIGCAAGRPIDGLVPPAVVHAIHGARASTLARDDDLGCPPLDPVAGPRRPVPTPPGEPGSPLEPPPTRRARTIVVLDVGDIIAITEVFVLVERDEHAPGAHDRRRDRARAQDRGRRRPAQRRGPRRRAWVLMDYGDVDRARVPRRDPRVLRPRAALGRRAAVVEWETGRRPRQAASGGSARGTAASARRARARPSFSSRTPTFRSSRGE